MSESQVSFSKGVQAYVAATATGTMVFILRPSMVHDLLDRMRTGPASMVMIDFLSLLMYSCIIFVSVLPFWLTVTMIARRFAIGNIFYFVLWGGVIGITLGPAGSALGPPMFWQNDVPQLYWDRLAWEMWTRGPYFAFMGSVAGFTYWWIAGRRLVRRLAL